MGLSFQDKITYTAPEFQEVRAFWQQIIHHVQPFTPSTNKEFHSYIFVLQDVKYQQWIKITKGNVHSNFVLLLTHFELLLHKCFDTPPCILLPLEKEKVTGFQDFFPFYLEKIANSYKENVLNTRNAFAESSKNAFFPIELSFPQNSDYEINKLSNILCFSKELHPTQILKDWDLCLSFEHLSNSVLLEIQANTHFFSDFQFQSFCQFFEQSLSLFLANPNITLTEIHQHIYPISPINWDTHTQNLVEWFEQVAENYPNHIALKQEDNQLTYNQLNDLSNRIAKNIQTLLPHQNGARIAVLADRSCEMIASFLAILKTGNCYVPIDTTLPAKRIDYILKDAKVSLVIGNQVDNELTFDFPFLSFEETKISESNFQKPQCIDNETPAYIIYTSGTTGNPKGCVVSHKNIVNLMKASESYFSFTENDVWVMAHSPSFDFSVWEMYGALLYGGKLILSPKEDIQNIETFLKLIIQEKVTVLNQTPIAFQALTEVEKYYTETVLYKLKYIIFGGDKLYQKQLINFLNRYKDSTIELINMYGITETTVHVTFQNLDKKTILNSISNDSNIGKPLPHLNITLFDNYHFPQITGFEGEIYVYGSGVSLGYFEKEELTKERFITYQNTHFYCSGDIAIQNSMQEFNYIGRRDKQIKIRGHRVELQEIAQKIESVFNFEKCLVQLNKNYNCLVAYYIGNSYFDKKILNEYLPEYMIPTFWVNITNIPLTNNRKIDENALPSPTKEGEIFVPQTDNEKLVANVFYKVLNINNINADDNFFSLGGDSIKAILMISELRKYNYQLQLKEIFSNSNITTLAKLLKPFKSEQKLEKTIDYKALIIERYPHFSIQKAYPITNSQLGILVETLKQPEENLYSERFIFEIQGNFETSILHQSFDILLKNYPTLNSFFAFEELAFPLQICVDKLQNSFQYIESKLVKDILNTIEQQHFDLQAPNLFRLTIVKNEHYTFIWSYHHILLDGWCISLIMKHFFDIYEAIKTQKENKVSLVSDAYENYLHWLNQQNKTISNEYWKSYLYSHEQAAILPYQKLSVGNTKNEVKKVKYLFDNQPLNKIRDFCKVHQLTLNTFFQTIWGILLQRYNHQTSVTFGTIFSGRPSEIENINEAIGLFINTLPIIFSTPEGSNILDILKAQQQLFLTHEQHQYLALADIQKVAPVSENLFHHLFVFENYPIQKNILNQNYQLLKAEYYEKTHYHFQFMMYATEIMLEAEIIYNPNFFDENIIIHIFDHFNQVINQILNNHNIRIEEISLISGSEQQEILTNFNKIAVDYPHEENIISLLLCSINKNSNKIALCKNNQELLYSEIPNSCYKWRQFLQEKSIKKGEIVGVMIDRNIEIIPIILAIFQIGAVYVPIDKEYPKNRIDFIVNHTKIKYIITDKDINQTNNYFINENYVLNSNIIQQEDTAYLIFTSGSTGEPKAVEISHGNLYYFIRWALEEFQHTDFEELLAGTSFCFDLSIFELFFPLCAGKTIRLLNNNLEIPQYLHQKKLFINTVPSVLTRMLTEDLSNISAINSAGEALPINTAKALLKYPNIELWNLYAPSETTTYSTFKRIQQTDNQITIGSPIAHTQIVITDLYGHIQPKYIQGEIVIAGKGVAKGYYQNSEITKQKFKNSIFGNSYFTGDFGFWNNDGELIFVGRKDSQTKLRGYRIELEEIEQTLKKHSQVIDAVAMIYKEKLIVFVAFGDFHIEQPELVSYLQERLPKYMQPNDYIWLKNIPQTPNGKVDKTQLILFYNTNNERLSKKEAQNSIEAVIVSVWQEILGKNEIGVDDNFFQLGGDSIKAMQMASLLHKKGYKVSIKQIFQFPNIELLASEISIIDEAKLKEKSFQLTAPLSPIQKWFFRNFEGNYHHFNQSVFLKTTLPIEISSFRDAVEKVINHHPIFKTRFEKDGNSFIQLFNNDTKKCFDITQIFLSDNENFSISDIINQKQRSLNIHSAKWLDILIFSNYENIHHLFITIHHLVIDGVSWRIFLEDLQIAYQQLISNQKFDLQEITTNYSSWTNHIIQYSKQLEECSILEYWKPFLSLENHYQMRSSYQDTKVIEVQLSESETQDLLYQTYQAYHTEINDILLSALELAAKQLKNNTQSLHHLWQNQELIIGLEGHGREQLNESLDLTRSMGWFTSIFPIMMDNNPENVDIREAIIRNKENFRRTPQKGVDFGIINEILWNKPSRIPYYPEICFNYLGQFDGNLGNHFELSHFSVGDTVDLAAKRMFAMDINALITENCLKISFSYDIHYFSDTEISDLSQYYLTCLQAVIAHCKQQQTTQLTASDFGANGLSQDDLATIQDWVNDIDI